MEILLDLIEQDSQTWQALMKWSTARRLSIAESVLAQGLGEQQTDVNRGKAAILGELLNMDQTLTQRRNGDV